jgi:hypothetical protein
MGRISSDSLTQKIAQDATNIAKDIILDDQGRPR